MAARCTALHHPCVGIRGRRHTIGRRDLPTRIAIGRTPVTPIVTESNELLPRVVILHPNDGCLTIARRLARCGVEIHVVATPHDAHVLASRAVTGGAVLPDTSGWAGELEALAARGPVVALCGSDAATEWVAEHHAQLPPTLSTFESGDGVHTTLMDKVALYRLAERIGVRVPWTRHVAHRSQLVDALDTATYPCIVKPRLGHLSKALLGVGTTAVDTRSDLLVLARTLLDHRIDFLVSEVVPGPESGLEGAVAVRAADGSYALEYGRRKVRQWPLDTGVGSLTESADVPETRAMARRILDHVGYRGIAACETKRHGDTGELYLIEINVRIPGTFGLADACGVDGSWRLYATLAGLPLDAQPEQVDGRKVVLPHMDVRSVWARVGRGELTATQALRSWSGTRDFGVVALRDPAPAFAMAGRLVRGALRRFSPTVPIPVAPPAPVPHAVPAAASSQRPALVHVA